MKNLIDKAFINHNLNKTEIVELINNDSENHYLFQKADETRAKYVGNAVHLRALIEFSNICKNNCQYCGLQRENKNIKRYAMTPEDIYQTAKRAVKIGYKTIVLQSGESETYSIQELAKIITKIKLLNVAITLSIGEKNADEYVILKEAGADRFLLRIETTDFSLYEKLHPEMSLIKRMACIKFLKKCGYETGTGNLVGLPNQTAKSLAEDILFFREVNADMIGLGPFIPNPDTPLKNEEGGTFEKALKIMAITRLLMPDINIPATTAMETLNPNGRIIALQSGANVVMPNVNSTQYSSKYNLYPGKNNNKESAENIRNCIEEKIKSIGRTISKTAGFRIKR